MVRSFTVIEDGSTSLSSLSDLTPVLPLSVKRRYVLVSLCSLRNGGLARHPRGCVATRSTLRRDWLRAAAELELGAGSVVFIVTLKNKREVIVPARSSHFSSATRSSGMRLLRHSLPWPS